MSLRELRRRRVFRNRLNSMARRARRRGETRKHEELSEILGDEELLDAAYAECCDRCCGHDEGLEGEGRLIEFLQWLIDNADEIFAIIARILAMFQEIDGGEISHPSDSAGG